MLKPWQVLAAPKKLEHDGPHQFEMPARALSHRGQQGLLRLGRVAVNIGAEQFLTPELGVVLGLGRKLLLLRIRRLLPSSDKVRQARHVDLAQTVEKRGVIGENAVLNQARAALQSPGQAAANSAAAQMIRHERPHDRREEHGERQHERPAGQRQRGYTEECQPAHLVAGIFPQDRLFGQEKIQQ